MKIVHVITGLSNGGAEAVLYRLATNDATHNHLVVSLMVMGKYGPLLDLAGIQVVCLNMPKGRISLRGLIKLWRFLRNEKPEVIQTWMYHADLIGGVVGRLAGMKNINWGIHHTTLVAGESSTATIIIAKICAWLSFFIPQNIICCAGKAMQIHRDMGYSFRKMHVISNGYQLNLFRPDPDLAEEVKVELGQSELPLLGMVGRFDPLKDHANLVAALGMLKRKGYVFRFLLVGTDMDHNNNKLNGWMVEQDITGEVVLLGQRNDIPAIMNALDLHVLSSSSEAFPNVIAEAMACGTPCVCTDVGDASLIVGDTGWVVGAKDPNALAVSMSEALEEMHAACSSWNMRGNACRKRIANQFSLRKMLDEYHRVWGL